MGRRSHKDICENYIKNTLGIDNPKNLNSRALKVDYAIDSSEGIICFEAEASTKTTNESDLHILGHLLYQIMLNRENKNISTFFWLVGPGEDLNKFKIKVDTWIELIQPEMLNKNILPIQKFDKYL